MDHGHHFYVKRPPNKLIDAIFAKRLELYDAAAQLQPDQILDMIPITFPMKNVLNKDLHPGVVYFDVGNAAAMQDPYFPAASWVTLCKKIAEQDMVNLASIFDLCGKVGVSG